MIVGIDGTPAVRKQLTGTEVYARSIIDALAASSGTRTMRIYANAVDAPPWLPAGVEWRGIPFPRLWTHWRLRQALRRERPDVTFIPSHVLPLALGLRSVVTIHDLGHRREPRSYSRAARWPDRRCAFRGRCADAASGPVESGGSASATQDWRGVLSLRGSQPPTQEP